MSLIALATGLALIDAYPARSRYAPGEPVMVEVELDGRANGGERVSAKVTDLGTPVGNCASQVVPRDAKTMLIRCRVPTTDFHGYRLSVVLADRAGRVIGERSSAIDVSSNWSRFPRYGYFSRYSKAEGTDPAEWARDMARFHLNGAQFYDFQYRHEQPLAGTPERPAAQWKDIAGRPVEAAMVRGLIDSARQRGIMTMAYNASYSAYDDAFSRPGPLPLRWATWDRADGPRTAATAKSFDLNLPGWSTTMLFYMNQNDAGWQRYLQGRMRDLFAVYRFDGWHIDTFGARGAFAHDGTPIDYIAGFAPYIASARRALGKPIVFNAVATQGQALIAKSDAEFVYSELWEDHETFADIARSVAEVKAANPDKGYVLAAYVHRRTDRDGPVPARRTFNPVSVRLLDAAIFALGAAHIELGDGGRMLSSEYFPNDRLSVTPELRAQLRDYYDFAVANQHLLRGPDVRNYSATVTIEDQRVTTNATPGTIWSIPRSTPGQRLFHLINLTGSVDGRWRDIAIDQKQPDSIQNSTVLLQTDCRPRKVTISSPDVRSGEGVLAVPKVRKSTDGWQLAISDVPLSYWSMISVQCN